MGTAELGTTQPCSITEIKKKNVRLLNYDLLKYVYLDSNQLGKIETKMVSMWACGHKTRSRASPLSEFEGKVIHPWEDGFQLKCTFLRSKLKSVSSYFRNTDFIHQRRSFDPHLFSVAVFSK